ncbi:MAG: hypothetical protein ABJI29_03200 [Alphaproteobacteria bacterium]|uniref:hypothetical protein n=1 Tax=Shimia sp. TaxID=1954381 RepID=UPI003297D553
MTRLGFEKQYLVRVFYKSGASVDFWTSEFSRRESSGMWTWSARGPVRPFLLGPDDISAVFNLKTRWRFVFRGTS